MPSAGDFLGGFGGGVIGGSVVRLVLDTSQFNAELAGAEAKTKAGTSAMATSTTKSSALAKAGLLALGVAAVDVAVKSVQAYQEHEKALAALQNRISKSPALVGATTDAFDKQAVSLQDLTGANRDQVISADAVLARFNLTQAQIQQLIPLVVDYAQVTGQDVTTAATGVGRALLGNTRALKTVGIEMSSTMPPAQRLGFIMDQLSAKVGGAGEAFGKTSAGQMKIFQEQLHDLEITIGQDLVPILTAALHAIQPLLPILGFAAKNANVLVAALVAFGAAKFLPILLGQVARGLAAVGAESAASRVAGVAMAAGMSSWIAVAAVGVAVLIEVATHLEETYKQMTRLADTAAVQTTDAFGKLRDAYTSGNLTLKQYNDALDSLSQSEQTHGRNTGLLTILYKGQATAQQQATSAANDAITASKGDTAATDANTKAHQRAVTALHAELAARAQLTGGVLGLVSSLRSLTTDQNKLNAMQDHGREGTKAYRDQLLTVLQDQQQFTSSLKDYIKTADTANKSQAAVRDMLEALGVKAGISKQQVDALSQSVFHLASKRIDITANTDQANAAIDALMLKLRGTGGGTLNINFSGSGGATGPVTHSSPSPPPPRHHPSPPPGGHTGPTTSTTVHVHIGTVMGGDSQKVARELAPALETEINRRQLLRTG